MEEKLLECSCGDCTHWEVVIQNSDVGTHTFGILKCVTCGKPTAKAVVDIMQ